MRLCLCRVEAVLKQAAAGAAVVWVTHDDQQPGRVGGKVLQLPAGDEAEVSFFFFFTL